MTPSVRDRLRVLIVDDDPDMRAHMRRVVTARGEVVEARSVAEAMSCLGRDLFDVVLLDVRLLDGSGLDVLEAAKEAELDAEFIVVTAYADIETAVEAMRRGAYGFLGKPFTNAELLELIGKAAEKRTLRRESSALREVVARRERAPAIIGESEEIRAVLRWVERLAQHDSTVLLQGESGTGKELIARAIHRRSGRAARPFVPLNCGAVPDTLLETELFGHKRGAFSGSIESRTGLFEAADGGTLFLDEIAEMSASMQVHLLRVLDSGEIRRVGEERTFHVDVRIVSATAKDLEREAKEGRFRLDLFYRVSTVIVTAPPLCQHPADIPLLLRHFAGAGGRSARALCFSDAALDLLTKYRWPGNVRELRNFVERLQIIHDRDEVGAADLPPEFSRPARAAKEEEEFASLTELQRRHVERVLDATGWNKTEAARILKVDIKTLNRKISETGLKRPT